MPCCQRSDWGSPARNDQDLQLGWARDGERNESAGREGSCEKGSGGGRKRRRDKDEEKEEEERA